jgi:hypothetical protein
MKMGKLTKPVVREIIDDFTDEIEKRKTKGPKPARTVIDFRNERKHGIERDVYLVPFEILRYRKDNGRISSDVLNYERNCGVLDEKSEEAQKMLRKFLEEKDKEKTEELTQSIKHEEQREPAIITCDGFLINGNRRKMVLEKLWEDSHDTRFLNMKVVILPGKKDEGGPPTLLEIEQIENRYQLQSDGKAEYYAFDRALSIKRKMALGMSIDEQLRDDPVFSGLDKKTFEKAVRKYRDDYLKPLECIDRYLDMLDRQELYGTVSSGLGDPEGRWQAFYDYYNSVFKKLEDPKQRLILGVTENEVGKIESVAFKIIRLRQIDGIPSLSKVHQVMRRLPSWLSNEDAKKEILKLIEVKVHLPKEECRDKDGNEYDVSMIDKLWCTKYKSQIVNQVKKAAFLQENKEERETPLELLESALKKLNHDAMDPEAVPLSQFSRAMDLAREIKKRAQEIESEFYHIEKEASDFTKKKKK